MRKHEERVLTPGNVLFPLLAIAIYFGVDFFTAVAGMIRMYSRGVMVNLEEGSQVLLHWISNPKIVLIMALVRIVLFGLLLFLLRKRGTPYVFLRRPQAAAFAAVPLLTLAGLGLTNLWMLFVSILGEHFPFWAERMQEYESLMEFLKTPEHQSWGWSLLAFGVAVPVAEELLFRGLLLSEWKLCMNRYAAVVLSALVFGIFHADWIQGTYAFLLGVLIGVIYVWTESLYAAIFVHVLFNCLGGVLPDVCRNSPALLQGVQILEWVMVPVGIVVCLWFYRFRRAGRTVARGSRADRPCAARAEAVSAEMPPVLAEDGRFAEGEEPVGETSADREG